MYSHYHGGLHLFNTAWEQRHRINETFVPSSPRVNPLIRANFIPYPPSSLSSNCSTRIFENKQQICSEIQLISTKLM